MLKNVNRLIRLRFEHSTKAEDKEKLVLVSIGTGVH